MNDILFWTLEGLMVATGIFLIGLEWKRIVKHKKIKKWPMIQVDLVEARREHYLGGAHKYHRVTGGNSVAYHYPIVHYKYEVDGQRYSSRCISTTSIEDKNPLVINELLRSIRGADEQTAYINPNDPYETYLMNPKPGNEILAPIILIIVAVIFLIIYN